MGQAISIIPILGSLLAAAVGGGLVILSNFISDVRRQRKEDKDKMDREEPLLVGLDTIRDFIGIRLLEWREDEANLYPLFSLNSARKYLEKLIEKASIDSAIILANATAIGLKLDAVLEIVEGASEASQDESHMAKLTEEMRSLFILVAELELLLADFGKIEDIVFSDKSERGIEKMLGEIRSRRWPQR